jgi:predicted transcriptional regulator
MEEENKLEFGYVLLSDEEISQKIGMSVQTIKKYHKSLIAKGYLTIIKTEDGSEIKQFNLRKLSEPNKENNENVS